MMHPDDYADQRRDPDAISMRHATGVDLAFWFVILSGALSVMAQW